MARKMTAKDKTADSKGTMVKRSLETGAKAALKGAKNLIGVAKARAPAIAEPVKRKAVYKASDYVNGKGFDKSTKKALKDAGAE